MSELSLLDLYNAYVNGYFPMADEHDSISWYSPDPRAIIPIDTYKPSKSLRPVLNAGKFEIRINQNFRKVMEHCSKPRYNGDGVWISEEIISLYTQFHSKGFAHSVEAFVDGDLVGGLYGVCIGAAFFGESMFHLQPNASKVAFHYLIEILKTNHFKLLDTQFINDNVKRYGAIEIPRSQYLDILDEALSYQRAFKLPS